MRFLSRRDPAAALPSGTLLLARMHAPTSRPQTQSGMAAGGICPTAHPATHLFCSAACLHPTTVPRCAELACRGRQVALDVAEGLRYLHTEMGVLHSDLKPS